MTEKINRREFFYLTSAVLAALAICGHLFASGSCELKGGTARVNITPPVGCWLSGWASRDRPSEGVSDSLYAKSLVLSNDQTEIVILAADLIGVTGEIVSEVRKAVEQETGIAKDNILISASHTHFGPGTGKYRFKNWKVDPDYIEVLKKKIAAVVVRAHGNLTGVRVGSAKGQALELLYNRRTKRPDGKVMMTFVLPPAEPDLIFGPVDPEVGVLRVEDSQGNLLASMINFACHPVSGGGHGKGWESWFYHISADYPAYATQVVEKIEGGNCLFTLGTAGDMVPIRRGVSPRFEIGRALGGEALKRLQLMPASGEMTLAALSRKITLPMKKQLPENSNYEPQPGKTELTTEIQGIRIGETVLIGLPGEVLVELGLEIKKKAGVENLFLVSLANDTIGYICHRQAYEEGGYEPIQGSLLAPGSGEMVVEAALKVVAELRQGM